VRFSTTKQEAYRLRKKSGNWLPVGLYMKTASTCLMRFCAGPFDKHLQLPTPISLTGSGLPRCIPAFHRRAILKRDERAYKLVKFYLSCFTLSKIILIDKKKRGYESIIGPLKSDGDVLEDYVNRRVRLVRALLVRYVPAITSVPMVTGLKWLPTWTSSPVSFRTAGCRRVRTPFHRCMHDLYALIGWIRSGVVEAQLESTKASFGPLQENGR
jgi:hypothetical protein